ncbi:MAG: SIR2 family protein, partial [bacterium]|nr:SIR2 family protein [bacterium]
AASTHPERAYAPVLASGDIARARAPRIVKLHGSLPSNGPFIFTEEDFRRYPRSNALFVNLAQQVLVENVLCLIGFSGDDPNFLQWSGWVRDHLGPHTPTIFLVGALDLSSAKRTMLQKRHVSPVDLSPALTNTPPGRRHEEALVLFLDSLRLARPWPAHQWPRSPSSEGTVSEEEGRPAPPTAMWAAERRRYPGWVVAPHTARIHVEHETAKTHDVKAQLEAAAGPDQHRLAYELAWRQELSLDGFPAWLEPHLEAAVASNALSDAERLDVFRWRAERGRERGDTQTFNAMVELMEGIQEPEAEVWAVYERALWARDHLAYAELMRLIPSLQGQDPIWSLRIAALLADLHDEKHSIDAARAALRDLRLRQAQARDSIWVASRLSWALFVSRTAGRFGDHEIPEEERGDEDYESWPAHLTTMHCNAWNEREAMQRAVGDALIAAKKPLVFTEEQFDPGRVVMTRRLAGTGVGPALSARRFLVASGLPRAVGWGSLTGELVSDAMRLTGVTTGLDILRLAYAARGRSGLVNELLSRLAIARLDHAAVVYALPHLMAAIPAALERGRRTVADGESFSRTSLDWYRDAGICADILSRLVVRLSADEVVTIFNAAIKWFPQLPDDRSTPEAVAMLLERCLGALPRARRGDLLLAGIELPVVQAEAPLTNCDEPTPDLMSGMPDRLEVSRSINQERWTARIGQLLQMAGSVGGERHDALRRLRTLHVQELLTEGETKAFAEALWRRRDTRTGAPEDTGLLFSTLCDLPEPEPGVTRTVTSCLMAPDAALDPMGNAALSLTQLFNPALKLDPPPLSREDAKAWFQRIITWRSPRTDPRDPWPQENLGLERELGRILAFMVLPALQPGDLPDDALAVLSSPRQARSLVFAAPAIARTRPDWAGAAADLLRRGVAGSAELSGSAALEAIPEWARLASLGGPPLPPDLVSAVATSLLSRPPTLRAALVAARRLVPQGAFLTADLQRLDHALNYLLGELDYQGDAIERIEHPGLTRAAAVSLAVALRAAGRDTPAVASWLTLAPADPLPEVRLAAEAEQTG